MAKKLSKTQLYEEKLRKLEVERRFHNRNWKAMSVCNANGLTIYPAAQKDFSVRLFIQKGEKFKPLSMVIPQRKEYYDQSEPEEVMEYTFEIDRAYEEFYNKHNNKKS